jgi:hypothetical protein
MRSEIYGYRELDVNAWSVLVFGKFCFSKLGHLHLLKRISYSVCNQITQFKSPQLHPPPKRRLQFIFGSIKINDPLSH